MKLSAKRLAKLPTKAFGLPQKARTKKAKKKSGNYPMPDKQHAMNAKARSKRERKRGYLTKAEFDRINRKADKILKKGKKQKKAP